MDRSRRQVLGELAAAFGAILVGASVLGRFSFGKRRPGAKASRARGGTPGAQPARVRPAPFTVKRHG
jgi:hypothetical protein